MGAFRRVSKPYQVIDPNFWGENAQIFCQAYPNKNLKLYIPLEIHIF